MLISLWMIKEKLKDYVDDADIKSGARWVDTFRVIGSAEEAKWKSTETKIPLQAGNTAAQDVTAKSMQDSEHCLLLQARAEGILLRAGEDTILLSCSLETAVNELIHIFYVYENWEQRLKDSLNLHADLKETLEIFNEVCPYPTAFMELDGSVIASSERFSEEEVNDNWYIIKTSQQVPMRNQTRNYYNETLDHQFVDETPQYLDNGDGEKYIGMYFSRENRRVMGMIVIEYGKPFTPDIYQLCELLHELIGASCVFNARNARVRTRASILFDLLEGNKVEAVEMDRFYENESFIFPWQIVVIREFHSGKSSNFSFLFDAFNKNIKIKTVILYYNECVLALVQQEKINIFLEELGKILNLEHYQIGISMAFHSLQQMPLRYRQACFAMTAENAPGIRYCEKFALDYIIQCIKQNPYAMEMLHPALEILRRTDIRKNSQLYETLNVFLHHDRSINATAQAMFVHRNSMLYRINKIKELTGINLDDPMECEYLRISYLTEQSEYRKLL